MKQYPRIYSLSTLGLIHHQEFDYLFHPFRTDFIGESGSGKSMIADLIQLIFVGSDAFESATKATGKREPEGMVLSEGGHAKTMGYAFLNIEMQPKKYLVVGSCIETGNKNVQAFIVQQGFDKNNIDYFESPLSFHDFVVDNEIQPLDRLKDMFTERGLYCQSWMRLKKFHEILFKQNIVPIDLSANDRQLKDYAEILQSFSRGKLLDTQKSSSLKDFLFGKEAANKIYETYKTAVKDMEVAIGEYGSNLKEIERVSEKQKALLELKTSRDERDRNEKDWIEKNLLYANQESASFEKTIIETVTEFIIARQHFIILQELLNDEIIHIEKETPSFEQERKNAEDKYDEIRLEYKQIEKVDIWLKETNCSIEQIKGIYEENNKIRSQKIILDELSKEIENHKVEKTFDAIQTKDSVALLNQFITNVISDSKLHIETKESLVKFSNLKDPDSFAYWAIQQKRAFSLEEESVIIEFQKLPRRKPTTNNDYLPSPTALIAALQVVEKEESGFWLDLGGLRKFIKYTSKPIFNTADTKKIESYFSSYSNSLGEEIKQHKKELSDYISIQNILLALSNPSEALTAYNHKESIVNYKLINSLNISVDDFNKAMKTYENKVDVVTIYSKRKLKLDGINEKINGNNTLLQVYKSYKEDIPLMNNKFIEQLLNDTKYNKVVQSTDENYNLTKDNVQLSFRQSSDKSVFIKKSQDGIRPKLSKILEIQSKTQDYEKLLDASEKAKQRYIQLYHTLPDSLISNNYIAEPVEEKEAYIRAEENYVRSFKTIIQRYIPIEAFRFEGENNLSELAKNLLPEAFHDAVIADQAESTVIDTIANYLHRINDKNQQLNNRKIQKIKDLLHEVDVAVSYQENTIRRIDNFLKNESTITGGYKARLKKTFSPLYPKEWMNHFQENLEDSMSNLIGKLSEKVDLENMMITAFLNCGGHQGTQLSIQKLLDPSVYYEVVFNMESETGRVNKGSTGQTYAATALLCIARLSVMDREESKKQQPAVRIMPIDEAEGLGSNYDMLYDIAQTYDYQIISLSIGPVGKFKDGEQYLYMLHKNMETEIPINYTPMAILSELDKSKIETII